MNPAEKMALVVTCTVILVLVIGTLEYRRLRRHFGIEAFRPPYRRWVLPTPRKTAELESRIEGLEVLLADVLENGHVVVHPQQRRAGYPTGAILPEAAQRFNESQDREAC